MMSTNTDESYQQNISGVEQMKEEIILPPATGPLLSSRSKPFWVAIGFTCAVVAFVAYRPSMQESPIPSTVEILGSTESSSSTSTDITPCTFEECAAAGCNPESAPFTCLWHNGGVHGGCSQTPWTEETCDRQCDVSGCSSLEIPDTVPDCNQDCPADWCETGRLCGDDVPYQCRVGASAFGCSDDPYQWTFRVSEAACSACCKITSCN